MSEKTKPRSPKSEFLYQDLAQSLADNIRQGTYAPGEKLPSVRQSAKNFHVSVSTVVSAYYKLESMGYIESRPKSGFYVRSAPKLSFETPTRSQPEAKPSAVTGQEMVLNLVKAANDPNILQFGAAVPDSDFLPIKLVSQAMKKVCHHQADTISHYEFPPGNPELRRQIARRMSGFGCEVSADDIVITNGCQESLRLALRACAEPGDIIAIESPTFYGLLQVINSLRMKAIEIPTDPNTGISISALEMAIDQWPIKACVTVPTFSNPLGFSMPDDHKRRLNALLAERDIPLIEDDVYGELSHRHSRPKPLKAFDPYDNVIYCSSFSKTLSPGLRVGWVSSKRYYKQLEYLKYVSNLSTSSAAQLATLDILQSGRYDLYLRRAGQQYAYAVDQLTSAIVRLFPPGTKVTRPEGGFVIWVELPYAIDTFELANRLIPHGISIAPGRIFSTTDKYNHFFRLSCALKWNRETELAILKILHETEKLHQESQNPTPLRHSV